MDVKTDRFDSRRVFLCISGFTNKFPRQKFNILRSLYVVSEPLTSNGIGLTSTSEDHKVCAS
jgi:hypothetical protein